ncbi:MAG: hypothetical protein KDB27_14445 [Planctomycetales bacterium]|nr:hypothetical protein [Planctomycetales bacterium]
MPCSECNFFQPVTAPVCLPRSQRFGECRRHPPKNVGTPLHRENQTHAVFPIVSEDDWCGEFVEWPAPLGERATNQANAAFAAAAHDDATRGPVAARAGQCEPLPEHSPGRRD